MKIVEPNHEIVSPNPFKSGVMLWNIEQAGRTCYKSEDKATADSAEKFVRMIIQRGHESVLEHESISVRFIVDRGVSHELVRHRLCAFSQESTRYCAYDGDRFGGEVTFIRPPFWRWTEDPLHKSDVQLVWEKVMGRCENAYLELLDQGAKPEEARSVLPNSLKTEIVVTANLREWRHILKLRTSKKAHPQMRQVMLPLLAELRDKLPAVFEDIEVAE